MDYLEIAGTAIGVLYLWLEYRVSPWLWVASIAMSAIYLEVYYSAGLYADLGINVYYIIASAYGLWCWLRRGHRSGDDSGTAVSGISRTPPRVWSGMTVCFAALFAVIWYVLDRFTDSNVAVADALTTSLSIVALWMLSRKYVEQWLVWIVVNVGSAMLYLYKDLPFTTGLYTAYAVVAWLGYRRWLKLEDAG